MASAHHNTSPMPAFIFLLCYLAARTVLWTVLLHVTQPTLPMDVLEHLAWGREWKLVYAHHPGLPAWLNEIFYTVGGVFALSLLAPLCTAVAIGAAYYTARIFVPPQTALVAALSLEGVLYFNVLAVEFNHNIVQLAACAWLVGITARQFLAAPTTILSISTLGGWALLGLVAVLTLLAKYSSVLFLLVLLLWSVAMQQPRKHWQTVGPWVAVTVGVLLNIPQLLALTELNFAPLHFALARADGTLGWYAHILYPLRFFVAQAGVFTLAGILCIVALTGGTGKLVTADTTHPQQARFWFLFAAAFGPLILAMCLSLLFGFRLRSMWGTAMLTFVPLWILAVFPRPLNWRRWRTVFIVVAFITPLAVAAIQIGGPYLNQRGKRIHYPSEAIAAKASDLWQVAHPNTPLCYVVGAKHIASLVAFYADARPSAVLDGDWQKNFWTTPGEFQHYGGIIVWVADDGRQKSQPPAYVAELGSKVKDGDGVYSFRWQTKTDLPPLKVGFALVAPQISAQECPR